MQHLWKMFMLKFTEIFMGLFKSASCNKADPVVDRHGRVWVRCVFWTVISGFLFFFF